MALRPLPANAQVKPLPQSPVAGYIGGAGVSNGGGMDANILNTLLSTGIIGGDLSAADASFIRDAYLPPKETSTQIAKRNEAKASKQQAYDRASRLATQALEILNQPGRLNEATGGLVGGTKNVSGFSIPQMLHERDLLPITPPLPGWGFNEDRARLNAILGQLSGITAFDEAGKALTATELGIVGGKVPSVGKGEKTNRIILEQILNDVEAKRNEYLFSQVGL